MNQLNQVLTRISNAAEENQTTISYDFRGNSRITKIEKLLKTRLQIQGIPVTEEMYRNLGSITQH